MYLKLGNLLFISVYFIPPSTGLSYINLYNADYLFKHFNVQGLEQVMIVSYLQNEIIIKIIN